MPPRQALVNASVCERQGDVNGAIRLLRSIRLPEHRDLTALSEQIATELRRLTEVVERQTHEVKADLSRARELLAASVFGDAVRLLRNLPKKFQTEESDRLLAEATSKQNETLKLKADIREAIEKKQLLELAPEDSASVNTPTNCRWCPSSGRPSSRSIAGRCK